MIKDIVSSVKDERILKALAQSVEKLKSQGAIVEEVEFGEDLLRSAIATYFVISCCEAASNDANLDGIKFGPNYGGDTYQEVMTNARTRGFSEQIKRRFVIGSYCLKADNREEFFIKAQKNRARIVKRTNEILSQYDLMLTPAASGVAPFFEGSSEKLWDEQIVADVHLVLGNFAGLPSITVPLCFENGLPVGANFMGRAFDEKTVLFVAKAFEDITGLKNVTILNRKEGNL